MLCLKAEVLGRDMYSSPGVSLPVNVERSIQKLMHKVGKHRGEESLSQRSDPSSCSSGDVSASCSGIDDDKSSDGAREGRHQKMYCYRSQLEKEVQNLQQQLQEKMNLHVAFANAITYSANNVGPLLNCPSKLPDKALELLDNILTLEITVSKLEEELATLQLKLCRERNDRSAAENHIGCAASVSPEPPARSSSCMWEEHISCLRVSKFGFGQMQQDLSSRGDSDLAKANIQLDDFPEDEFLGSCRRIGEGNQSDACLQPSDAEELKKDLLKIKLWAHPNLLSEEMVKCMRKIFLCLSESSDISSKASSSECLPSQSSPVGQLSPSLKSFSDASFIPSKIQNPSSGTRKLCGLLSQVDTFDPYGVNGKLNWRDIGCYSLASEVSWMSVGQEQLEYASESLKGYRPI